MKRFVLTIAGSRTVEGEPMTDGDFLAVINTNAGLGTIAGMMRQRSGLRVETTEVEDPDEPVAVKPSAEEFVAGLDEAERATVLEILTAEPTPENAAQNGSDAGNQSGGGDGGDDLPAELVALELPTKLIQALVENAMAKDEDRLLTPDGIRAWIDEGNDPNGDLEKVGPKFSELLMAALYPPDSDEDDTDGDAADQ